MTPREGGKGKGQESRPRAPGVSLAGGASVVRQPLGLLPERIIRYTEARMTTRNRACKPATEPRPNDDETINMKRGVCCWSVTWNEGYFGGYFLDFFVAGVHASKHGMNIRVETTRRFEYYFLSSNFWIIIINVKEMACDWNFGKLYVKLEIIWKVPIHKLPSCIKLSSSFSNYSCKRYAIEKWKQLNTLFIY